ncbi:MAG: ABC transporter substrate-binding protein [Burkholderiales bacterium]
MSAGSCRRARAMGSGLLLAALLFCSTAFGADTIKIAFIDPLSGPLESVGQSNLRQYQAAVERVNSRGGARGLRFELVAFDSKSSADDALAALESAIAQGIRYATQGVGADVAAALIGAIGAHNDLNPSRSMLFVNYGARDPALTNEQCSFWHFRFDAHAGMRLEMLAAAIAEDEAIRRVYLLNPDNDAGLEAGAQASERLAHQRAGIEIVGDELYPVGQRLDFDTITESLAKARADAVVTAGRGGELAMLVQAIHKAKLKTRVFALHAAERGTPAAIGEAGAGRVTTVLTWHPNVANNQLEDFASAYKAKHEEDWMLLSGNLAVHMLATAIEGTRTLDPLRVAQMLEGIDYLGPTGPVRMRRDDHQIFQPLFLATFTRKGADGVKHDTENSGFGWKTETRFDSDQTVLPTTCRMRRPG